MAICNNKQYEREFIRMMTRLGIDSHRIAGSGVGEEAVCDCIVFYNKRTYVVEVKATKEKILYMRTAIRRQLERMIALCQRNEVIPILAIKFKYRGWNMLELKELVNVPFNEGGVVDENNSGQNIFALGKTT